MTQEHEIFGEARWICRSFDICEISRPVPAPLLRKGFDLASKPLRAQALICGLGFYELYINGVKASSDVLAPVFTAYDKTVLYCAYDVTDLLREGGNAIGAVLGNGWYNPMTDDAWGYKHSPWRHHTKLICSLRAVCEDGSEKRVISDTSWKTADSPIIFDSLRNGEHYDARREIAGWSEPCFDDSLWQRAKQAKPPGGRLAPCLMPNERVTGTIRPVSVSEVRPGVWVFDLGAGISGWARISVSGEAGETAKLRYAERLLDDGSVDLERSLITGEERENGPEPYKLNIAQYILDGEFQTDKYTLRGGGTETWEPRFTYHGFQYVELSGLRGVPGLDALTGRAVHTPLEACGGFECSSALINEIQKCAVSSTLHCFHGMPTDCPHREKNYWTGDAHLSCEQTMLNFAPVSAYRKWMGDFRDAQRPSGQLPGIIPTGGWGYNWGCGPSYDSAVIIIPWTVYLYSGDVGVLEDMYGNMALYMDYLYSLAKDNILDSSLFGFGMGDWAPPTGGWAGFKTPVAVTDTAYYYMDAVMLSDIAGVLGKDADKAKYARLAREISRAFKQSFFDSGVVEGACQTSQSSGIYTGILDGEDRLEALRYLEKYVADSDCHIDCGITGAKWMVHALTDMGRADLVFKMATQPSYPGWGFCVGQGATSLWEAWNGDASRIHHMYSDISAWFYKGLAGINPDPCAPGFKNTIIRPNPVCDLTWAKAWHKCSYGTIAVSWVIQSGTFKLDAKIPEGCTADIIMPSGDRRRVASGEHSFSEKRAASGLWGGTSR